MALCEAFWCPHLELAIDLLLAALGDLCVVLLQGTDLVLQDLLVKLRLTHVTDEGLVSD